ncbi:helix-turn-helix domain-containing protein [uncultured Lutibacter sp.]|uniref:helix-turn-helix domain-containing protein n=1 Tax=uncultured Lutibacter sp. TaxID=437739 RepID=UPI00262D5F0B|nr:helix-turn-helix domain-containing protein [uncultured Lutibacter sp.]
MSAKIITPEDLNEFKNELLENIKSLMNHQTGKVAKKWIKSTEVKEFLGISNGTLQNLRINGTIPYTKVGGVIYYDLQEIEKVLENNRVNNNF